MNRHEHASRLLPPMVFPAVQLVLFAGACLLAERHPWLAAAGALLAGAALNFTIHIFVHEMLHWSDRHRLAYPWHVALSLLSGVAFNGYRLHHHNHHQHVNGREDFSRTWRITSRGPVPCGVWRYAWSWPVQVFRVIRWLKHSQPLSPRLQRLRRRMRWESLAIFTFWTALLAAEWRFALLYAVMVYFGWVVVSIHNYGQHPPDQPSRAASYHAAGWYNRLFCNNGLHHEHHADPTRSWRDLQADPAAPRVAAPHFAEPLLRRGSPLAAADAEPPDSNPSPQASAWSFQSVEPDARGGANRGSLPGLS